MNGIDSNGEAVSMILRPGCLVEERLSKDELREDKKNSRRFGPCAVGEKAVYLNSFYIERMYYIPLQSVKRIYKRIAMSKGGFTGKGVFATIPYLVVEYNNGEEKQCNFKIEEDVDSMIAYIKKTHPEIKTHSKQAEQRIREKEAEMRQRKVKNLTKEAQDNISILRKSMNYLNNNEELSIELSAGAKRKRVYDRSNPAYKWVALFITLMGVVSSIYGVYAIVTHAGFAMYFLLFGLAAIFLFSSANVLPTARNNRQYIEKNLEKAVNNMQKYIAKYPEFPIPAHYAHPIVLKRMIDIIEEGRAVNISQALNVLKEDLKALNSSVAVEQDEYDEIMAIKPMFLIRDYE